MKKNLLAIAVLCCLVSCGEDKKDETDVVNRAGAVETAITVQHADSTHDIILTTHKIWVNFNEYKTIIHHDTIPALGMANTTAENSDGDTQKVVVKKDYEIFITVK
jgi:hypothetical protein